MVNYTSVEDVRVFAGAGDDTVVSDDTAQQISVYGNEGNDQFYVGSILGTEDVLVDGQVVDTWSPRSRRCDLPDEFLRR